MVALTRAFFARPSVEVAPELLGKVLHRTDEGTAVRILEVEAYAQHEPACHAHRGPTPANATLFGPPGHAYLYFTYGMHWCANLVTGTEGVGEGVLLRAGAVQAGEEVLQHRRPGASARDLLRGPARLARALGLDRSADGTDVTADGGTLLAVTDDGWRPEEVARGPRVGVRLAADLPWRFWVAGDPRVSPYRRHPKAARAGDPR